MSQDGDGRGGADVQYQVVASRRQQWDNLVWQVPIVSLTGQAFLFTIALSDGNHRYSRLIASGLAFIAAVLSMTLMARHRKGEVSDAQWLGEYECSRGWTIMHGPKWRNRRDSVDVAGWFSRIPQFWAWMVGFGAFALAALATFVVALAAPNTLG